MMLLYTIKSYKLNLILSKSQKVQVITRGYPGHARSILTLISKAIPKTTALVSMREINLWNAITKKAYKDLELNTPKFTVKTEILKSKTLKPVEEVIYLTAPEPVLYLPAPEGHFNPKHYSGLLELFPEYNTWNLREKTLYKYALLCDNYYILYVLGKYKMYNDENFIKHFPELLKSAAVVIKNSIDQKIFRDKMLSKLMGLRQHKLIRLCCDKQFSMKIFKQINSHIDMSMYSKLFVGTLIEIGVFEGTLGRDKNFIESYTIMGVDHESPLLDDPLSICGYSRQEALKEAGQMHTDWFIIQVEAQNNGILKLIKMYKDSKMFESSLDQGRLHLKPELIHNKRALEEYFTKITTGIRTFIIKNNLTKDPQIIYLAKALEDKVLAIRKKIHLYKKNSMNDFENMQDIKELEKLLEEFNGILIKAMQTPQIASKINLGISADPGRLESDFLKIFEITLQQCIKQAVAQMKDDKYVKDVYKSKITPKERYETYEDFQRCIMNFPEGELKDNAIKAIEYIFN